MSYLLDYLFPNGPVTRAIRKRLRQQNLRYKTGYLGKLMDENFEEAQKSGQFLYRPQDLKKLDRVDQNPDVVDIAFQVIEEMLAQKDQRLPTEYVGKAPYRPDIWGIAGSYLVTAATMTVLITLIVVFVEQIWAMTTLITVVSIIGAIAFVWALTKAIVEVQIDENT